MLKAECETKGLSSVKGSRKMTIGDRLRTKGKGKKKPKRREMTNPQEGKTTQLSQRVVLMGGTQRTGSSCQRIRETGCH